MTSSDKHLLVLNAKSKMVRIWGWNPWHAFRLGEGKDNKKGAGSPTADVVIVGTAATC